MPRPNVFSAGKGHVASQNESEPLMMIKLFRTLNHKLEMNRLLDRRGKNIEDIVLDIRNNNQRRAGLQQLQTQQPGLAVKANAFEGKKTRESRKGFAPDGRLGDIWSGRVHEDPMMRLTSFGDHEYIESPAH